MGNIRTFQGGFTEGLSRTQLALGMYADEVGNVYNAMGELVEQTDKAAKQSAKELRRIRDNLDIAAGDIGAGSVIIAFRMEREKTTRTQESETSSTLSPCPK